MLRRYQVILTVKDVANDDRGTVEQERPEIYEVRAKAQEVADNLPLIYPWIVAARVVEIEGEGTVAA